MADETSLKGIIQGMMSDSAELMQGTVISESPVKIQMANDEKLIINERIAVIPRHLSDYTSEAAFDGEDPLPLTVYNGLKTGEKVYVLSLNRGKLYYVLDRVVS
ncbi:MAG: DUF2577 domain-containing protein [Ruminococcus sp.]|nr:DUF2577 domain-containing protein [Ruminococcus sp.]